MADAEQLALIREGVATWNAWRNENPTVPLHLSGADLSGANLIRANLGGADLSKANLSEADFFGANLSEADLSEAKLNGAYLISADLSEAKLSGAELSFADLRMAKLREAKLWEAQLGAAKLSGADLRGADLSGARLHETDFGNTNLKDVRGLDSCQHHGPSVIDHRTLVKSAPLPLVFLQGCGLPETLIEYLPSLLNEPIQFYSCFISYSHADKSFARRLGSFNQLTSARTTRRFPHSWSS